MSEYENKQKMQVLHITGGDLSGGAARGAYWLHQGLLDIGAESKRIIQKGSGNELFVEPVAKTVPGTIMRLFRIFLDLLPVILYRKRQNVLFSTGISGFDIRRTDTYRSADIIHLHWINNGMINIKLLKTIEKPIVWTMRDMGPFTGGCYYTIGCEGYQTGCGSCHQLKGKNNLDRSWYVLKRKKRYYPKKYAACWN